MLVTQKCNLPASWDVSGIACKQQAAIEVKIVIARKATSLHLVMHSAQNASSKQLAATSHKCV